MHPYRRQTALHWWCALRARYIVCLALFVYIILSTAIPHALGANDALAPLVRLSRAAAPLSVLLVVPLPAALWRAWRERRLVHKLRNLDALRAMDWSDLEILMRRLFEQRGYRATRTGGAGADGGVDILLRRNGRTTLVQCKQWKARRVSVSVVRELLGVVTLLEADGGIVVTCGVFTTEARDFARRANLVLLDGLQVLELARPGGDRFLYDIMPGGGVRVSAAEEDACRCPVCGGRMVRRRAKTGARSGRSFLGCANFPGCRGTRNL